MRKKSVSSSAGSARSSVSGSARSVSVSALGSASGANPTACGVLISVELGAEFPSLRHVEGSLSRVLAQTEGESPAAFAERVANSLDGLFGRGVPLGQLALACNERIDDAALAARRKLAGFALGAMAKQRTGKAYFTTAAGSSGRLRHALSALAQGLSEEWRTADLEVSVDFGDEARSATGATPFIYTARVA
jgi:hypothetical protein